MHIYIHHHSELLRKPFNFGDLTLIDYSTCVVNQPIYASKANLLDLPVGLQYKEENTKIITLQLPPKSL